MKAPSRLLVGFASLALVMAWVNIFSVPEAAADHCSRGQGTLSGAAIAWQGPIGQGAVARERHLPAT
jgi:hypothetical protein